MTGEVHELQQKQFQSIQVETLSDLDAIKALQRLVDTGAWTMNVKQANDLMLARIWLLSKERELANTGQPGG